MKHIEMRNGFALPMAMLLLLAATGAVMVTLNQGATERRIQDTDAGVIDALALAETGLERFVASGANWSWSGGYPIPLGTTGSVTLTDLGEELGMDGFAEVSVRRLWVRGSDPADPDSALFVVRSRGVRTQGGWSGAPQATRVVSRLVRYERPEPLVLDDMFPSAWTSLSGLLKNGSSGSLTGYDAAAASYTRKGEACGNMPAKAGVAVPEDPGYQGDLKPVSGEPPVQYLGETPEEAAASVDIDWNKMIDGKTFPPQRDNVFVIPDEGTWYDITAEQWDDWPVVVVNSDELDQPFDMPKGGGKGTLIVTGDATISGSNLWEGLVMIGGKLTSNGNNTVSGAVLSGLNVKLAGEQDVGVGEDIYEVEAADIGNGTKTFEYNSCYLMNAMDAVNAAPPPNVLVLENTWLDTWAQY